MQQLNESQGQQMEFIEAEMQQQQVLKDDQ